MKANSVLLLALLTLAGFGEEKLRENASRDLISYWAANDPTAAEAWLAKVNLPDDRKERLLSRP
jgi:hypothetical protein